MKTQIYANYSEFFRRADKSLNGVSATFAERNPGFEADNADNEGCWNCSRCSGCSRCSRCSGCSGCSGCSRCSGCSGCSRCSRCSDCSDCWNCSDCSDCSDCSRCSGCSDESQSDSAFPRIPIIENIHTQVYAAASQPNALNMGDWHTCSTTHCRAGWVTFLAGEAGKKLELATSTEFAAKQIYKASSPIRVFPPQFYTSNDAAMVDMKRCADLESAELEPEVAP